MESCIFCKIASGEIKSEFVYENDYVVVINDLNPQAKVHLLVIPKIHVESLRELEDEKLMSEILKAVKTVCKNLELNDYRIVSNIGADAGQTVMHLHIHILSGEKLSERMN